MGRQWQIGDPVDYTSDGWMDAQNWTGDHYIVENDSENDEYSKKAWDCYNDFRDEEALHYINRALDLYDRSARDWNLKGLILSSLKRYEESEECFDRSFRLYQNDTVSDNKARMLYKWSSNLLEESKKLPDGLNMLEKAQEKILKAISIFSGKDEGDLNTFNRMRDSIDFYIGYEKEFQNKFNCLKKYDKNELFTITGQEFYKKGINLTPGLSLKLVKEPDNEFDRDAIAVYAEDEKIGYVANNTYTKYELTSSASQLQDKIPDIIQAEYLFYLDRYESIQFNIGRIIK